MGQVIQTEEAEGLGRMKIICRPRCSGKTTEIIEDTIKANGILLTHNIQRAQQIARDHPELKGRVHSFDSFYRDAYRGTFVNKLFIDDLDEILHSTFGYSMIGGITLSGQPETGWDT